MKNTTVFFTGKIHLCLVESCFLSTWVHKHSFWSHSDLNEWSHKLLEPISPAVSAWFVHCSHWKPIRTTSFSVNSLRKEKETQPLTTWINDSRCTVPIIHWAWLSFVKVFERCPWGWTAAVFKWWSHFPIEFHTCAWRSEHLMLHGIKSSMYPLWKDLLVFCHLISLQQLLLFSSWDYLSFGITRPTEIMAP